MEVIDNGSHIKDSENQATGMSFSCRIPRDINIGNGAVPRNKGETDVRLLVACKTQLSSEVIRWKTESLRLQKERDVARIRMKELDQVVGKFSERTKELENRLSVAEDENKRLRGKILGSSSNGALQKLSVNFDKYHSYPWTETLPNTSTTSSSCLNTLEMKKSPLPQEDWKEVSQRLLEKMKQEMKEIAEFNCSFSLQENKDQVKEILERKSEDQLSHDELNESLSSLISEQESLKHRLIQQNKALKSLMNNITPGNVQLRKELSNSESKAIKSSQSNMDQSVIFMKDKSSNQFSRHSDDSVRAFFTKHLEGCRNLEKVSKTMQLFMQSDSQNVPDSNRSTLNVTSPRSAKSQTENNKQNPNKRNAEEDRVCPICQASFHETIPQNQFEQHVLDHLEVESASLLDQYVVL